MHVQMPNSRFGRFTTSMALAAILVAGGAFAHHAGARSTLAYDIDQLAAATGAVPGAGTMQTYDMPALQALTARVIADIGEDPSSLANLDADGVRMFMKSLQVVEAQLGPFPSSQAAVGTPAETTPAVRLDVAPPGWPEFDEQ